MDDVRTIGDNSRHFEDSPPQAAPQPITIGKDVLLDPGMITEQLGDDYQHYTTKTRDLVAGALRLFAKCAGVPVVAERPTTQASAPDSLALLVPAGGGEILLLGATKDLTWTALGSAPAGIMRTLAGRGAAIPDEETAEVVTSFVKQIKDNAAPIEKSRQAEKKPYDGASTAVQAWFKALLDPLGAAATSIEAMLLTPWTSKKIAAEQERLRAEALRAQEAAAAALAQAQQNMNNVDVLDHAIEVGEEADRAAARAAAPEKDLARTRGSLGGVAAVTKRWTFKVIDEAQIPREYWTLDEAALANVARNMKEKASVPGVQFFPEVATKVRR